MSEIYALPWQRPVAPIGEVFIISRMLFFGGVVVVNGEELVPNLI